MIRRNIVRVRVQVFAALGKVTAPLLQAPRRRLLSDVPSGSPPKKGGSLADLGLGDGGFTGGCCMSNRGENENEVFMEIDIRVGKV
jgi:hypothetical protein